MNGNSYSLTVNGNTFSCYRFFVDPQPKYLDPTYSGTEIVHPDGLAGMNKTYHGLFRVIYDNVLQLFTNESKSIYKEMRSENQFAKHYSQYKYMLEEGGHVILKFDSWNRCIFL